MEFRTKIPLKPQDPKIEYGSDILLLGSCFVENMGKKLEHFKFRILQNPFGVLFHPAAIAGFLENVVRRKEFQEEDVFYHNERWHCFDAHSSLSSPAKEEVLQQLNSGIEETYQFLKRASHVIITLGTAWGYQHKATERIVTNCHKIPQQQFSKELMDVRAELTACVNLIQTINPAVTVVFTVSPVRHLKDGFSENQQSKARLVLAVHEVISSTEDVCYFPSYEIMMDELRDYRFYGEDMIHPNPTAVNYIWQRFTQTWVSPEAIPVMEEVAQIQKGLGHKPFHENSESHQIFLSRLQEKIASLQADFPHMQF